MPGNGPGCFHCGYQAFGCGLPVGVLLGQTDHLHRRAQSSPILWGAKEYPGIGGEPLC